MEPDQPPSPEPPKSTGHVAAIVIGTLFVVCGGWIFAVVPSSNLAGFACGVVILLLGLQSIVAGARRRPSWLSKIGPLP